MAANVAMVPAIMKKMPVLYSNVIFEIINYRTVSQADMR